MEWWEIALLIVFALLPIVAIVILEIRATRYEEAVDQYGMSVLDYIGNLSKRRRH